MNEWSLDNVRSIKVRPSFSSFCVILLYNLYDFQLIIYIYIYNDQKVARDMLVHDGLMYNEYIIFIYIICKETVFNKLLLMLNNHFNSQ